ncbi:MAG: hypothetical protein ACE5E9_10545 [Nitrospinaceae bacterium]
MKNPVIAVPLIRFSSPPFREGFDLGEDGVDLSLFPSIRIPLSLKIPDPSYGVVIEDENMAPVLKMGMTAVFSRGAALAEARNQVYSIGRKGGVPLVRRVVRNDLQTDGTAVIGSSMGKGGGSPKRRKSFMTPTPLHVPESRVSPIAPFSHGMIFLKKLCDPDRLTVLPLAKVAWMHPLVGILE